MAGYSLHIGLNKVLKAGYRRAPKLKGCVNDALALYDLAEGLGFQAAALLDSAGTVHKVTAHIFQMARRLTAGDIFVLTYSGHGAQVLDEDGDEEDGLDESWVLYDYQLLDDRLHQLWARFAAGVRIVIISDSCHSGTIAKTVNSLHPEWRQRPDCQASGLQIGSCQDYQQSLDGNPHGAFTHQLLQVWDGGRFEGNYQDFHQAIAKRLPQSQQPSYLTFGRTDEAFLQQRPFTV
jgi:hypothetical protein